MVHGSSVSTVSVPSISSGESTNNCHCRVALKDGGSPPWVSIISVIGVVANDPGLVLLNCRSVVGKAIQKVSPSGDTVMETKPWGDATTPPPTQEASPTSA